MATTHTNRLQAGAIQPIRNEQPAAAAVSTAIKPIEPNDLSEVMTFAQVAVKSQMFGLRTIEEAAARILYGRELGMSVFQSIMGIDMIQGRPGLKAVTVASQIQRSGQYEYRVDKWTVDECTVKFFDRGEFVGQSGFTIADAKRAGVYKDGSNWSKYPKSMLFARAITQGARAYCPSIFFGPVYSTEELADGNAEFIDVEIADKPAEAEPEVVEAVAEVKPAKAARKAAKAEAKPDPEPAQDAPFDAEPEMESVADKIKKIDEWAERAARRFDEKGQASFAKAGPIIEEMYRRCLGMGFVQPGANSYRARTQAIASIEASWSEILETLKGFVMALATELESPPAGDSEPGSDG